MTDLQKRIQAVLDMDDPNNYEDSDAACESISDEFEDLSDSDHYTVCEMVEEWFVRGFDEDAVDEDECDDEN